MISRHRGSEAREGGAMPARKSRLFAGGVLLVLATVGAVLYGQHHAKPPKLTAEDWIEIRQLYSRYAITLDRVTDNADSLANLWTEDGVLDFSSATPPRRGRKEIAQHYVNSHKSGY